MTSQIPTLDIRRFTHPSSPEDRNAFVAELGAAYREWGFAGIRGHGIPQQAIDASYDAVRKLFALPESVKRKYHAPGTGGARGYTPFGVETAKDSKYSDLKEFWHIGRDIADDSKYRQYMPPNVWPEEVPEFRAAGYGLYEALDALGSQVLAALALHLGLPEDYFADKTDSGNSILRPIHYPPITADDIPNVRAGAHEDINLITLLVGASAAGLEVKSRKGEWVPFTADADTIVVNIGAQAALFDAVLPAPEPGFPDRRAALDHHTGQSQALSRADHRAGLPRRTVARDQAQVISVVPAASNASRHAASLKAWFCDALAGLVDGRR
jgi:isopenicillin N synthase-like dioxygenase